MTTVTGPHGHRNGLPFYFIHEERERTALGHVWQNAYWAQQGYAVFGSCVAGYLMAVKHETQAN